MSKETSKGPYGKLWSELRERDGEMLKGSQIVVPKALWARAIALAHKGHMQTDGTLRQLRETMWFRGMRKEVQVFVNSCKCAATNLNRTVEADSSRLQGAHRTTEVVPSHIHVFVLEIPGGPHD